MRFHSARVMFTLSGHSEFAVIARVHTLTSHLAPFPFRSVLVRDIFRKARESQRESQFFRLREHRRVSARGACLPACLLQRACNVYPGRG